MPAVLYHFPPSPPSRLALTIAKLLGADVTVKVVNFFANEHLKEDYLKINPDHKIPTLDDNGFIIWDSHAISTYLISQYSKDDSLYPKDPKKRAMVDQRMYFNASIFSSGLKAISHPLLAYGKTDIEKEKITCVYEALSSVERYLTPTGWVAGDQPTLADFALAITARSLQEMGVDLSKYTKIKEWLQRLSSKFPVLDEVNKQGERELGEAVRSRLPPNALAP